MLVRFSFRLLLNIPSLLNGLNLLIIIQPILHLKSFVKFSLASWERKNNQIASVLHTNSDLSNYVACIKTAELCSDMDMVLWCLLKAKL